LNHAAYCGSRQQVGLQGGALLGGQAEVIDKAPLMRAAEALISFSSLVDSQVGQ
jgi:hypothetical protein